LTNAVCGTGSIDLGVILNGYAFFIGAGGGRLGVHGVVRPSSFGYTTKALLQDLEIHQNSDPVVLETFLTPGKKIAFQ
jgi:hypothetical protein